MQNLEELGKMINSFSLELQFVIAYQVDKFGTVILHPRTCLKISQGIVDLGVIKSSVETSGI